MAGLDDRIHALDAETRKASADAASLEALEKVERDVLGRQGKLRDLFKAVTALPADQRGPSGGAVNRLKTALEAVLAERRQALQSAGAAPATKGGPLFDVTFPGRTPRLGGRHPIYATLESIVRVFEKLGFETAREPEIETEWYNFEALNIPLEHPAHDQWDTYYIDPEHLLRSHTSPVQIRTMQKTKPPLRIVAPGRVFRPDTVDASHAQMFHQVEGLMVGDGVSFADLKGLLTIFAREFFGAKTEMRFRPSFFPFTEPSAEVDISCILCGGRGCPACKNRGWMEILGAGMVHPKVFEAVGYDPDTVSGFAFGMGVERIAMLRYGIKDIRLFTENHAHFLDQFK
jgi:phenylalanyl-tRNA synthetase alpha chain